MTFELYRVRHGFGSVLCQHTVTNREQTDSRMKSEEYFIQNCALKIDLSANLRYRLHNDSFIFATKTFQISKFC
jgi:hypothetical protein